MKEIKKKMFKMTVTAVLVFAFSLTYLLFFSNANKFYSITQIILLLLGIIIATLTSLLDIIEHKNDIKKLYKAFKDTTIVTDITAIIPFFVLVFSPNITITLNYIFLFIPAVINTFLLLTAKQSLKELNIL